MSLRHLPLAILLTSAACRITDGDPLVESDPVETDPVLEQTDPPEETDPPAPSPASTPGIGLTSGGGAVSSPLHRGVITIGGPAPAAYTESARHKAKLGVGAVNIDPKTLGP